MAPLDTDPNQRPARFSLEWLQEVVKYHAPTEEEIKHISQIRFVAYEAMRAIIQVCPDCADRTTALQHIRDAMMRANASIVLRGLV